MVALAVFAVLTRNYQPRSKYSPAEFLDSGPKRTAEAFADPG
jgi:hypothetical protein